MVRFDGPRVLSRPHKVWWDGWETTTTRLQQGGWEISAEQEVYRNGIRLALRNQRCQMYGLTDVVSFDFYGGRYGLDAPLEFRVAHMASRFSVQTMGDFSQFKPIDAMPQIVNTEIKSIDDLGIFATPLVRTEEIIVEPQTVEALLAQIKKIQAPEQAAIRARQRLRENREGMMIDAIPRQRFHAQILSIAA